MGRGDIVAIWNVNHTKVLKYQLEIWHNGLNEHKVISAPETSYLINKVEMQYENWKSKWESISEKNHIENVKRTKEEKAINKTKEAEKKIEATESILLDSLVFNSAIDWNTLKDNKLFELPYPMKPVQPQLTPLPIAPDKSSWGFQPKLDFFSKISKNQRNKAIAKAEDVYSLAFMKWQVDTNIIVSYNDDLINNYNKGMCDFDEKVIQWNNQNTEFIDNQNKYNESIEDLRLRYLSFDVTAIEGYCKMVIGMSSLPDFFKKKCEVEYNPNNKILIIDYLLPDIEKLPNLKEVKYLSSKNEIKEVLYNDAFVEKLFDSTIYKLTLRVLHEEFEADVIDAIEAISFNGWVSYLDKATGNRENACIVSIQVKKESFVSINLSNVDPKTCFKSLKGIGSSKLAGITPIRPILTMNRNDKRFVASHDVTKTFDDSTNLAAIPWEEFEHLIREIFEKEFSTNGGEVKVTQASRDGGVDAIAYDPDPIRGGKIVIQAKRYTNTVGVSAVRDLYGTVMNEGAIKGILVTTADYGPDAYAFAENKPLTLLNGGNLLHMLENQGHKARIDLREAKALNLANGY